MAKSALTEKTVKAFCKTAKAKQESFDGIVPGFGVRGDGKGGGSWVLVYVSPLTAKRRRFTIAPLAVMSLADAREQAGRLKAGVAKGIDPAAEREDGKADRVRADTFAEVWEMYYKRHASKLSRGGELDKTARRELFPVWGSKPVTEITRYDIADVCGALVDADKPGAAIALFSTIRGLFNWCLDHAAVRGLESAPTDRMKAPAPKVSRDRILTDDEIRAVWSAFDVLPAPYGPLFKTLLLTGQRRTETSRMKRTDLEDHGDTGVWNIPGEDTKNGKPHRVFLAPAVWRIIKAQPVVSWSPYVFAGNGKAPPSNAGRAKLKAEDLSGVTNWRLHDLRRTCRSGMARLGVPVVVAEHVLNHVIGGLVGVYDRYGYDEEARQAWTRWAAHVDGLVNPKGGKVVSLREAS